ncbi:MAG: cysteine desulfurase [Ruminococcaceae bacterium]|nr:cysteine desulfurase [Oscillospiraceae bacterium]
MKEIYFDNSATTPLSSAARAALNESADIYANPSSLHRLGFESQKKLEGAREAIAKTLYCDKSEIIFTACGTESDNTAILGGAEVFSAMLKKEGVPPRIITTDSEHPAVSEPVRILENKGFEVIRLSTKKGVLDMAEVTKAATKNVCLATIMHTNNETGAVYDLKSVFSVIRKNSPRAILHTDAVQGYLHSRIRPSVIGADLISISGHKVHALKGIGVLYKKKGVRILPFMAGGGQESGFRSGTENLTGILTLAAAAKDGFDNFDIYSERIRNVRNALISALSEIDGVHFNIPEKSFSENILSIQVEGEKSEVLLHKLSDMNVFVSSGSACSSKKGKSGVLRSFGLTDIEADRTIRISLSHMNTEEEAHFFCEALEKVRNKVN